MSRIGQKPIEIPAGVEITLNGQDIKAKGSKGELELHVHDEVAVAMEEGENGKIVKFTPKSESKISQQVWPTMRTLVNNIVIGVSEGYSKKLEIQGVGFRANLKGKVLNMTLGFSHDVNYDIPEGIELKVEDQTKIEISGIDKQLVGQVAANIRSFKPPEPYKGKGIRYADEYVRRKEGKKK